MTRAALLRPITEQASRHPGLEHRTESTVAPLTSRGANRTKIDRGNMHRAPTNTERYAGPSTGRIKRVRSTVHGSAESCIRGDGGGLRSTKVWGGAVEDGVDN